MAVRRVGGPGDGIQTARKVKCGEEKGRRETWTAVPDWRAWGWLKPISHHRDALGDSAGRPLMRESWQDGGEGEREERLLPS